MSGTSLNFAPSQESLEETWGLEDLHLHAAHMMVTDFDGDRTLALYPSQVVDFDRLTFHEPHSLGGKVRHTR